MIKKDTHTQKEYRQDIIDQFPMLSYYPILFISVLHNLRTREVLKLTLKVFNERKKKVKTSELVKFITKAVSYHPPPLIKGKNITIKYGAQVHHSPPIFALFTNLPSSIPEQYKRYLENSLREYFGFLGTPINDAVSSTVIAQLLFLEAEDPKKDIYMYINSPGGLITAGFAILDTMNYIKPSVATICMGQASSMAAVLLAGGAVGKRSALPNSRVMIHQPLGGAEGQASDIKIQADEILRLRTRLNSILAKMTKQTMKKIEKDTDRNFFMNADEAKKYGIIDTILVARKK